MVSLKLVVVRRERMREVGAKAAYPPYTCVFANPINVPITCTDIRRRCGNDRGIMKVLGGFWVVFKMI